MVYNATLHREIGACPSNYILENAHTIDNSLPIPVDTVRNWKDGHPAFVSFRVGEKVACKIDRAGRQLQNKLKQKFEGPFVVLRVQPNKVTYEIQLCDSPQSKIHKVHHKQIKRWTEPPRYLKECLSRIEDGNLGVDDGSGSRISDVDSSSSSSGGSSIDLFPMLVSALGVDSEHSSDSVPNVLVDGSQDSSSEGERYNSGESVIERRMIHSRSRSDADFSDQSSGMSFNSEVVGKRSRFNKSYESSILNLGKLRCSEPVSSEAEAKIADTNQTSTKCDMSESFLAFDLSGRLISTPIDELKLGHSGLMSNLNFEDLSSVERSYNSTSQTNVTGDCAFADWRDDLLDVLRLSLSESDALVESLNDVFSVNSNAKSTEKGVEETGANEFEGFSGTDSGPSAERVKVLNKLLEDFARSRDTLSAIQRQLAAVKETVSNYQTETGRVSDVCEVEPEIDDQADGATVEFEISEIEGGVPVATVVRSPIITRSRNFISKKKVNVCDCEKL